MDLLCFRPDGQRTTKDDDATRTKNQIDYILTRKSQMKRIKNCRVYNSADIGSDHSLLMAKMMIQTIPKPKRNKQHLYSFDTDELSNPIYRNNFEILIGGRFQPLLDLDKDIDELYQCFKKVTNEVTEEVVGRKIHRTVENMPTRCVKTDVKRD